MANKIFKQLDNQKNVPNRNGFDFSRTDWFSSSVGTYRPVRFIPTLPQGEYEIDINQMLRTDPIIGAPFVKMSVNYDCQFVPYNFLYSSFNEFIAQREDKLRSLQPDFDKFPKLNNFYNFAAFLIGFAAFDSLIDLEFPNPSTRGPQAGSQGDYHFDQYPCYEMRLHNSPWNSVYITAINSLDMMRYGNLLPYVNNIAKYTARLLDNGCLSQSSNLDANDNYNKNHLLRQDNRLKLLKLVHIFTYQFLTGAYDWATVKQLAANNLVYFRTATGQVDDMFRPLFIRDYELSTQHPIGPWLNALHHSQDKTVDLWFMCAYNRFWYEYKRNEYYDQSLTMYHPSYRQYDQDDTNKYASVHFDYVNLFNLDDVPNGFTLSPYKDFIDDLASFTENNGMFDMVYNTSFSRLVAMLAQKPVQYPKDMFTGLYPSTQLGDVQMMVTDNSYHALLTRVTGANTPDGVMDGRVFSPGQNSSSEFFLKNRTDDSISLTTSRFNSTFKFDPALAISVLESRRANAMQRFMERALRAGNKTKKNFLAHWGIEPKSSSALEPLFLGSWDGNLEINTVSATTEAENQQIGSLGGNGVAFVKGEKVHFKSSDFGVIMISFYITKQASYDAYGLERSHQLLEPFDFPFPELQNISLQPLESITLNAVGPQFDRDHYYDFMNQILGYLPSHYQYKTDVDLVHDEFYASFPDRVIAENAFSGDFFRLGVFSPLVAPRRSYTDMSKVSFLYIDPSCINGLFKTVCNSSPWSYQFQVICYTDVKAVLPLSVIGLPD